MKTILLTVVTAIAAVVVLAVTPAQAARPVMQTSPFASTFVVITGPPRLVQLCRVTATNSAGQIREITCRVPDFKPIQP